MNLQQKWVWAQVGGRPTKVGVGVTIKQVDIQQKVGVGVFSSFRPQEKVGMSSFKSGRGHAVIITGEEMSVGLS